MMKINVYCRNFEKSEYVQSYVQDLLFEKIPGYLHDEVLGIEVWLKIENSILQRGKDVFSCKIRVKTRNSRSVFSSEKAADCYGAAKVAIEEVAMILLKRRDERQSKRRARLNLFRRFAFATKRG